MTISWYNYGNGRYGRHSINPWSSCPWFDSFWTSIHWWCRFGVRKATYQERQTKNQIAGRQYIQEKDAHQAPTNWGADYSSCPGRWVLPSTLHHVTLLTNKYHTIRRFVPWNTTWNTRSGTRCYFSAKNTNVYWDVLQKVVNDYNNAKHSIIMMKPVKASIKTKENKVQFKFHSKSEPISTDKAKFKLGDKVNAKRHTRPNKFVLYVQRCKWVGQYEQEWHSPVYSYRLEYICWNSLDSQPSSLMHYLGLLEFPVKCLTYHNTHETYLI